MWYLGHASAGRRLCPSALLPKTERHSVLTCTPRRPCALSFFPLPITPSLLPTLQAALVSGICFTAGGGLPLVASAFITVYTIRLAVLLVTTSVGLVFFGMLGARLGGANVVKGGLRVIIGGWIALAIVFGIGKAFKT